MFLFGISLSRTPGGPIEGPTTYGLSYQKGSIDQKDTAVEPTSWGNVVGRVYNATDGNPIENAQVSLQVDTGFEEKGKSTGKTDELGIYKAQCVLGRLSHNLDVGRLLLTSGIGLLFGGANNTTKRIDASRLNVRVKVQGFKTFEGVVAARRQNAEAFEIDLQPILLVPERSSGESVSAIGWTAVRIESGSTEPLIATKGQLVKFFVDVRAFGKNPRRNIEIAAESRLWKGDRILKLAKESGPDGTIRFEGDYKVTGKEKSKAERIFFYIRKSLLEFNPETSSLSVLLQTSSGPSDEQDATTRMEGLKLYRENKQLESQAIFKKLTETSSSQYCDLQLLAATSDKVADFDTEANAWSKMVAIAGKDDLFEVGQFVRSLYLSKRYSEIPPEVEPLIKSKKSTDWQKHVPSKAVAYLGLSYIKLGSIEQASTLNEKLLEWPTSGLDPAVIEFRSVLRLAQVEKAFTADPNSPDALAEYGRALLDSGRYEEAVAKLNESLQKGKDMPAVKRDLAWAALQIKGKEVPIGDLQTAVNEARAALNIEKGKQESKDFYNWNQYAILLYALSEEQRSKSLPEADSTADESVNALRKALTLGRKGATRNSGVFAGYTFGYYSSAEVAISGFAYPQANSSFILLDSLKRLRKDPNDYLALFNRSSALLDLGQTNLAKSSLDRLTQLKPDFSEGLFLYALLEAKTGGNAKAEEYLQKLLALNPIHPRANLTLAELLAQDGDVPASAERLALHAKYYGNNLAEGN